MPSTKLALLGCALLAFSSGCGASRSLEGEPNGTAGDASSCTTCHGDASRVEPTALLQAAPPATATGAAPGAHRAHLHAGPFAGPFACTECHVVPTSPAHSDGRIEVTFGALGSTGGASPTYAGGSCSSVYCHGATLGGGAPTWTGTVACGSCHGTPPPSHAATSTDCSTCHPGTVKPDGTIDVASGLHVNGKVDLGGGGGGGGGGVHAAGWSDPAQHGPAAKLDLASCRSCHGSDYAGGTTGVSCNACHGGTAWQSNCTFCHGTRVAAYTAADLGKAAPPRGSQGETSATERAVGAHQKHLSPALSSRIACAECHAVPGDLAHVNGAVALSFGTLARTGGTTPAWNGSSCSASYCHGAFPNGAAAAPVWTSANSLGCSACHRPESGSSTAGYTNLHYKHVFEKGVACASCHGAGYSTTTVNAATHVDGTKRVVFGGTWNGGAVSGTFSGGTCSISCHGSERW